MTDKVCSHNYIMIDCVIGNDGIGESQTLDWAMCESCFKPLNVEIKLLSIKSDKKDSKK